jgi:ligand-binding SRPBCC domain-containing protein
MAANSGDALGNHERIAADFLLSVFGSYQKGFVTLFTTPTKHATFLSLQAENWHSKAGTAAILMRERENVYFGIGMQGQQPRKGRGDEAGVVALPGLWADIDVLGPNHAATNLPPTLEDAWSIVQAIPFKPTLAVYSGGGLQCYWLFREPMEIVTDKDRSAAKRLSKGFQGLLRSIAARSGWSVDNTSDLCRLLRVPGTYNRKQDTPALVRCEVTDGGQRYNPSDFTELLELEANPELRAHVQGAAPDNPRSEFPLVLAQCPWMRHCKDDAARLPEPEWYRWLSIVGRCKDGARLAHDQSKWYPKYTEAETDEKLRQAMGAAGPATCAFIENELGQAQYCGRCNHRGKIKSPIVLGISKNAPPPAPAEWNRSADSKPLPQIQVTDRQLRDMTREALDALRQANDPPSLFAHAGRAVRVTEEETGRCVIHPADEGVLRNLLSRSADFYETRRNVIRNCAPPMDVVKDVLATAPVDWGFPPLVNIIASPALREDGTVIQSRGYDHSSRLFYAPARELILPEIPDEPSSEHVQVAIDMILDILSGFPFVDDASQANAIASMLTPICRPAIRGPTPLALFDATTQGTGKTLLTEVVSLIVSGREGAMFSAPREADEWRKQLTSVLREGTSTVIIDNVVYRLDSADLCKALTETIHGDRILGQSQIVSLPVRCTWIATGNNIQLGGDMLRRCYWVRIDAKCPRPYERSGFRHKRLKQYVLAHRGELLAGLLALARSWFVAGCPPPDITPLGSFEDWTTIVGGILQHAGVKGFLANSGELSKQADTESVQWEAFLKALANQFYGEPFTVAQAWECMNDKTYNDETHQTALTERARQLREALPDFIAHEMGREGYFKQRLGIAFRERVGRRYGDTQFRIERDSDDAHGKVARWNVIMNP